jgi:predicted NBD/HSP70 family sugar kinase
VYLASEIGCAVISGGQLLTGARDRGGEIAHTPAVSGGETCSCGRHGCLRAVRVLAARQEAAGLFRGRTRKRSMYSSVKTRCSRISSRAPSLSRSATLRRMRSW